MSPNSPHFVAMPALPLARSVPVRCARTGRRGIVLCVLRGALVAGGEGCEVAWDDGEHHTTGADAVDSVELRVDTEDPQGFGYALRYWARNEPGGNDTPEWWWTMVDHWASGSVTAADRLALARALAKLEKV